MTFLHGSSHEQVDIVHIRISQLQNLYVGLTKLILTSNQLKKICQTTYRRETPISLQFVEGVDFSTPRPTDSSVGVVARQPVVPASVDVKGYQVGLLCEQLVDEVFIKVSIPGSGWLPCLSSDNVVHCILLRLKDGAVVEDLMKVHSAVDIPVFVSAREMCGNHTVTKPEITRPESLTVAI